MNKDHTCPDCGAVIPADAPSGFCPRCELAGALAIGRRAAVATVSPLTEERGQHAGASEPAEPAQSPTPDGKF